jgi:DNA-binding response OmpR family regulator
LAQLLAKEGINTQFEDNSDRISRKLKGESCDLLVLDVIKDFDFNMFNLGNSNIPVMVLVPNEQKFEILSYECISDFAIKPIDLAGVAFRIRWILKKHQWLNSSEILNVAGLTIDLARCEVIVDGDVIDLTFREYELLKFLVQNRGRVFSREVLLNRVWGYDYFGGDRTVDVHIRRLRSKIEQRDKVFIETVRNIGYRFQRCT